MVGVITVLMIIASDKFRDEELFDTQKVLEDAGVKTVIASTTTSKVTGMLGGVATPQILLKDVDAAKYDAVVFVGGGGAAQYFKDSNAHNIAKAFNSNNKVVAAICIGPRIIAQAGLLKNKKFTSWDSEHEAIKKLGGILESKPAVRDGKIVTANGPTAAKEFGKLILHALK